MKDDIKATSTLDTSGKCCRMPMVETNKKMKSLSAGDILQIIATDPGTQVDIPSWCKRTGHELITAKAENNIFEYYVRK